MSEQSIEKICFVVAPIGKEGSEERFRSDKVLKTLIKPSVNACGFTSIRADEIEKPGIITHDIIWRVAHAPLVIADLTDQNPNVFYELALRHTLRKSVIQIVTKGQNLPFDTADSRTIFFDLDDENNVKECIERIIKQIQAIESSSETYDNPISVAIDLQTFRNSERFTTEDIREELTKIPDLEEEVTRHHIISFNAKLRQYGIETKGELRELMSLKFLDLLRNIYTEELNRPTSKLLDPLGISDWGGYLFTYGINDTTISAVTRGIRNSDEYRQSHPLLVIHRAVYGANDNGINDKWIDVTDIVVSNVQNNSLTLIAGNSTFKYDPNYGIRKSLKVTYSYRGQVYTKEVYEDEKLELP